MWLNWGKAESGHSFSPSGCTSSCQSRCFTHQKASKRRRRPTCCPRWNFSSILQIDLTHPSCQEPAESVCKVFVKAKVGWWLDEPPLCHIQVLATLYCDTRPNSWQNQTGVKWKSLQSCFLEFVFLFFTLKMSSNLKHKQTWLLPVTRLKSSSELYY